MAKIIIAIVAAIVVFGLGAVAIVVKKKKEN